jgi:(S)-sulfolactate dehydrogenase
VSADARYLVAIDRLGTLALLERAALDADRRRRLERMREGLRLAWLEDEPNALQLADAYVTVSGVVNEALLKHAACLRLVQLGGHVTRVDMAACAARGISVSRVSLFSTRAVAEHVLMAALALVRRLAVCNAALHGWAPAPPAQEAAIPSPAGSYNWAGLSGLLPLRNRRLGILGLGDVGMEAAQLARAFGLRTAYSQRHRVPDADERRLGVRYVGFDELIGTSEILSLHVRRSPDTVKLISRDVIRAMPVGAMLIDTTRGGVVDQVALAEALHTGHLSGAAVDVFPEEPMPPGNPLVGCPNALLTPHCAGGSADVFLREIGLILDNVRRGLSGGRIRGLLRWDPTRRQPTETATVV